MRPFLGFPTLPLHLLVFLGLALMEPLFRGLAPWVFRERYRDLAPYLSSLFFALAVPGPTFLFLLLGAGLLWARERAGGRLGGGLGLGGGGGGPGPLPPHLVAKVLDEPGLLPLRLRPARPYVGVVKAVLRERAPGVEVVDLAHDLPPQDLRRAAYVLFEAVPYLPEGAVLLAVVDPGVGTSRRAVAARGRRWYVGPDNGLFTLAWLLDPPRKAFLLESLLPPSPKGVLPLPGWRPGGATFHGRDRFAPAAAHLALGLPLRLWEGRCPRKASSAYPSPWARPPGGGPHL